MNDNPGSAEKQIQDAINAWFNLRASKKFLNLTLDEFKQELKPCLDIRTEIKNLETRLTAARNVRDTLDVEGLELVNRFVNAIKADEAEGQDSELLEAMGYIIKSKRKSGLHRITPESNTTPIQQAA